MNYKSLTFAAGVGGERQSARGSIGAAMAKKQSVSRIETLKDGSTPIRQSAPEEHCVHILQGHTGFVLCLCTNWTTCVDVDVLSIIFMFFVFSELSSTVC